MIEKNQTKIGRISSIQTMGTLDGPGIRFILFLQGCPLRCDYCHNPETWPFTGGQEKTVQEVLQRIQRYRSYFGFSGGLTVSGGEPLCQGEFVVALFTACQKQHIHCVLDTSGAVWNDWTPQVLSLADLVLLDIKYTTEEAYQKYTGGSLANVLRTLTYLQQLKKTVWLRQVIVPGRNDQTEALQGLKELAASYSCVEKVELLPFRKLCLEKYAALNQDFPLREVPEAEESTVFALQQQWFATLK